MFLILCHTKDILKLLRFCCNVFLKIFSQNFEQSLFVLIKKHFQIQYEEAEQQTNDIDCGVFLLHNVECVINGLFTQIDVQRKRKNYCELLLNK